MYDLKHIPKERLEKYEQIWASASQCSPPFPSKCCFIWSRNVLARNKLSKNLFHSEREEKKV